jgi:integrase
MTHKTASLWKYVKTADGWRYCKPVIKSNHKIDPRRVLVKGKIEECPSGQFYLCISGRWLPVGSDPVEALKAQQKETARLAAIANGFDLPDAIKQESETIADAIADFMDGYKIGKSVKKTTPQMQQTLNEFLAVCSQRNKRVLADLDKKDIMNFWQWALDSSPTRSRRTASNKTMRVHTFLKSNGLVFVGKQGDPGKWQVPAFVEELPEIYDLDQLQQFFFACDPVQRVKYETLLKTGLREMELVYLEKKDISFEERTLRVTVKPWYDFQTKTFCEREITIPADLIEPLRAIIMSAPGNLVFPTKSGHPHRKLLRECKRIAMRAGLNCGCCDHKGRKRDQNCREHAVCEQWYLHKFRATFAMTLLQQGIDIKNVQQQLGHRDIASTMRYLAPSKNKDLKGKIDAVWAAVPLEKKPVVTQ